jgi:penicillin V acylase-like amidase (Ntn superfamily)
MRRLLLLSAASWLALSLPEKALPCSRVIHVAADGRVTMARSMDWKEDNRPKWWVFPRGMARTGGTETNPLRWTSQHGSVVVSMYDTGTVEGVNEKGLMVQGLYLSEARYGTRDASRPGLSIMAYSQYLLDGFATVAAAVSALEKEPFQVVTVQLGGEPGTAHWALADSTGDSAIVEYLDGTQVIHHDRKHTVMCNSPTFDQQLAVNAYWTTIGGDVFLPGTWRSADRFVRATWYQKSLPSSPQSTRQAVAGVLSVVRNVSVPLGSSDPTKPNLAPTIYRTAADLTNRTYFYESTLSPSVIWVDLKKLDFSEKGPVLVLDVSDQPELTGDVAGRFQASKPFSYAK